jgi:hypothetical protein
VKTAWSASGSGRRLLDPGSLSEADLAWASRHLPHGLQVEPWVERLADFAWHGHLARDGRVTYGVPTRQSVDEKGRWLGSAVAEPGVLEEYERLALRLEVERASAHLARAGYWGPFNVDAYRYRSGSGTGFEPRCEINARYTMGWAVGMSGLRPDLDELELSGE